MTDEAQKRKEQVAKSYSLIATTYGKIGRDLSCRLGAGGMDESLTRRACPGCRDWQRSRTVCCCRRGATSIAGSACTIVARPSHEPERSAS